MPARGKLLRLVLVGGVVTAGLVGPVVPQAVAAAGCQSAPQASTTPSPAATDSAAQALLNPATSWPISRGLGQTVAVLDTGVSTAQLGAAVTPGVDLVSPGNDGTTDCDGRGTLVAGLITAPRTGTLAFTAVAPASTVLPVRVSEQSAPQTPLNPALLATGIRDAADRGASVIDVSFVVTASTALASAVRYAQGKGCVVVAAVGDDPKFGTPYPAAYPGVLGVASVDSTGAPVQDGVTGSFVSLSAPGADITGIGTAGGYVTGQSGTALAAAQVAGSVALVRAWQPSWTPVQVVSRLESTADHPAGPVPSSSVGYGLVDPYVALTAPLSGAAAASAPHRIAVDLPPRDNPDHRWIAVTVGVSALVLALAAAALMAGLRRARRRHWRPAGPSESPVDDLQDAGPR